MPRQILTENLIDEAIREKISNNNLDIVQEVQAAVEQHRVVVVGMGMNPFPAKTVKLLKQHQIEHTYLEYGSYLSQWRKRNALKMWTGWATFPMVFVNGQLVGGYTDLKAYLKRSALK